MILKNKPLIFDGAMGTYYTSICKNPSLKCELANIYDRSTILRIHKEYIDAGCKAIRTNTFAANSISLESDITLVKEVILKGYEIAIEAATGTEVTAFADIGPIPNMEAANLLEEYKQIADLFLQAGAQNFLFETFSSDEYLLEITRYIKNKCPAAFILVSFAVSPEGYTRQGESGEKLLKKILNAPTVDVCGFNCFSGPYHLLQYIRSLDIEGKDITVMPNSGYPTIIDNRTFFDNTKEYFADQMLEIVKSGVAVIGGCCGTTPEFIKETVKRLKHLSQERSNYATKPRKSNIKRSSNENILMEKIRKGRKIIAVELDPPVDTNIDFIMQSARELKEQGVDTITIADCPIARARVDSSLLACKLKRELGVTVIPHLTCRDRNINATKALLLGLNIEGVNNVLVVTGDPIPTAQRDEVKTMFSFNSSILAKYITTLNETIFSTPFNICAALNVNVRNFSKQLDYAKKKIESGVAMFLTQPVLSRQAVDNLKVARKELNARILGGIYPIVSYKNACFIDNEISGINISEEIIEMYRDISREEASELAVRLSVQFAKEIEPYVDGYYIITPFKRIDLVTRIIENINNGRG